MWFTVIFKWCFQTECGNVSKFGLCRDLGKKKKSHSSYWCFSSKINLISILITLKWEHGRCRRSLMAHLLWAMLEFKVQRDLLWQRLINSSKRHLISTEDHVTSYLLMFSFQFVSAFFSLFVTTAEASQRDGGYTFTPQYVCFTGKQLLSSVCRQNLTFLSLADDCSINAQMKKSCSWTAKD